MKCYFVDVKAIERPTETPDAIDMRKIEAMGKTIVECGGLLRPLLLRKTKVVEFEQQYELLSPAFYYYAAVEAKKLDPIACEMVNAFVLDADVDPTPFLTQLYCF